MQIIERGIMPDGAKILIEDWSNDYDFMRKNATIAVYPKAVNSIYKNPDSRHPYPERGETFRASFDFSTEEEAKNAFRSMVSGSKSYMDYMDNYSSYVIPKESFVEAVTR